MKIEELDMHCGNCPLIDMCAKEPYGFAICGSEALENMTTDEYKKQYEEYRKYCDEDDVIFNWIIRVAEDFHGKTQGRRWRPGFEELYWFITDAGAVACERWRNNGIDEYRYKMNNCFRTKETAQYELNHLFVLAEMQGFAFEPDWSDLKQRKYHIQYDCDNEVILINHCTSIMADDTIYFESERQAKSCIFAVGKERLKRYYFRVKDVVVL